VSAPAVSIVVLTWDRPAALRRCLESLLAQQGAPSFEILVADDGSGEATSRVVAELARTDGRIRHLRQPHRGIPAARNLGLRAARGARIGFVADDYRLPPDYLAAACGWLDARPDAAVVRFRIVPLERHWGGQVSHLYYDASIRRRLLRESTAAESRRALFRAAREQGRAPARPIRTHALEASGAAIFRADVLRELGGFDERLARGEDTELTARLHALGHAVDLLAAPTVGHDYERWPLDTLAKCWRSGLYRPAAIGSIERGSPLTRGAGKAEVLAAQLLELVDERRFGLLAAAVPWLVAFELAVRASARLGRWRRRWEAAPEPPAVGPAAAPLHGPEGA
jgi:GT2 family glycosyltransferase